jgi:chorismate mutase
MFSATDLERNLMGETAAPVKERIKDILSETKERAEQVVEDVKNEAVAQGLTSDSAEASLKSVVEKIGTIAAAGKESLLKPSPDPNSTLA